MKSLQALQPARAPQVLASASGLSRREFVGRSALACLGLSFASHTDAAENPPLPLVLFSKVCQELNLDFAQSAELVAEAGLNGIDCPVRPGGEVLPEKTAEQLPKYADALHRHGLQLPYITTAITSVSSPHTEEILRTAKKLGVRTYRIGFIQQAKDMPVERQLSEVKAHLKELAALNREIGIGAVVQNHSPDGKVYLAGDLGQLEELVRDFAPEEIGVAFDIGHAIIVHGDEWRSHFERLKSHLVVAYVKDARRAGRWVPFGQGEIAQTGYFKLLKQLPHQVPLEMHIEYDWSNGGQAKTRPALLKVLRQSAAMMREWMA